MASRFFGPALATCFATLVAILAGCRTAGVRSGGAGGTLEEETPPAEPEQRPKLTGVTVGDSDNPGSRRPSGEIPPGFPSRVASVAFEVEVHPPGEAEIGGFVRDRDGRPVNRACVELAAPGSKHTPSPVFTSIQGNFRFAGVPPGMSRITITVEDLAVAETRRIPDYHKQDPRLAVMLRPLIVAPPNGRISVARIMREGDFPDGDGSRWIEVAPLALDLQGYSPACRRVLRRAPAGPR